MLYILLLICAIVGFVMGRILLHRPTNIRFKISIIDWMMPIIFIFILVSIAILFETMINDYLQGFLHKYNNNLFIWILRKMLDGGILVPFISASLSFLFGKLAVMCDLDVSASKQGVYQYLQPSVKLSSN